MKRTLAIRLLYLFIIITAFSCVPARQFEDVKTKAAKCEEDKARLTSENLELNTKLTEVEADFADLKKRWEGLKNDTSVMGTSLRRLTTNYDKLNATYERLLDQHSRMLQGKAEDHEKLMGQVQDLQARNQEKEDALRKLELTLGDKENNLNQLNSELIEREKRVKELESAINRKDSIVNALKDKVADALLGFQKDGLTVEQRNGKVYVSMEERLLFASGSWNVDKRGAEALKKLAKVLETQPDINVLIEGHTDSIPFNGSSQVKDNWDLSVMRATAITKIITSNSDVDPKRLTAAGRSKYIPLDSNESKEGRAKNRRTEIILTPKLDELFKILEN